MSGKARWKRRVIAAAVIVGLCLGVVVTRAIWQGRSRVAEGDRAMARGKIDTAVLSWSRAARWYVPLAPHVGQAHHRLADFAQRAEADGKPGQALMAWRALRSSILATRSFYTPSGDRLEQANRAIARLMAAEVAPAETAPAGTSEADQYQRLAEDSAPSVLWSLIALLGLGLWIGGGLLFALHGVDAADRLVARAAVTSGVMVAVGLVVWLVGLRNA